MEMGNEVMQIKQYCLNRLDEIDQLNESRTLSAFSCYAWLIGVLSHLAYAGQVSESHQEYREDNVCFKRFVGSFMPGFNPSLLYENFRCGLIHACSLDPTWKGDDDACVPEFPTKLFLTHDKHFQKTGNKFKEVSLNRVRAIVLYYKDLSDSIREAIEKMFENKDVCASAKKSTAHQRLVAGLEKTPSQIMDKFHLPESMNCADSAQLSGFYDVEEC